VVLSRQWSLCWQERLCRVRDIKGEVSELALAVVSGSLDILLCCVW
jgi:hypothetical protein